MGRRLFQEVYASQDRTDALGLPDLMVVSEADDPETADSIYHAVHRLYLSCGSQNILFKRKTNLSLLPGCKHGGNKNPFPEVQGYPPLRER